MDQVLLWIYGGGFWGGTTTLDLYDLRTIVSEENIIAVGIDMVVTVIRIMIMILKIIIIMIMMDRIIGGNPIQSCFPCLSLL